MKEILYPDGNSGSTKRKDMVDSEVLVEKSCLWILVGPPGVGKNYIGDVLEKHFGFFFYDSDEGFSNQMRATLNQGKDITREMRHQWVNETIENAIEFNHKHPRTAIAATFILDRDRERIIKSVPGAVIVSIEAPIEVVGKRVENREGHFIDKEFAKKQYERFQPVEVEHISIVNVGEGEVELVRQIEIILKEKDKSKEKP